MAEKDKYADEMLTDEELDAVAGGEAHEMVNDSRFLNTLTGKCDRYGEFRISFSAGAFNEEIEKAWASVGVKAKVSSGLGGFGKDNTYQRMDNGQSLTQAEARQYAMNFVGRQLKESDWNW